MSLDESTLKSMLIEEVNATDIVGISAKVDNYWTLTSSESDTIVRYLKTKRHLLNYLLGYYRKQITVSIGSDRFQNQDLFKNIQEMLKETTEMLTNGAVNPSVLKITSMTSSAPSRFEERLLDLETNLPGAEYEPRP